MSRKCELLETKLEVTSDELNEATAWVENETSKKYAAKEAVKCLMNQVYNI